MLGRVLGAYVAGIIAASLVAAPLLPGFGTAMMLVSLLVGLPILAVVMFVAYRWQEAISRNLMRSCVLVPPAVALIVFLGFSLLEGIDTMVRSVGQHIVLWSGFCAACASLIFFLWTRLGADTSYER